MRLEAESRKACLESQEKVLYIYVYMFMHYEGTCYNNIMATGTAEVSTSQLSQ